jgi:hypothetical protein
MRSCSCSRSQRQGCNAPPGIVNLTAAFFRRAAFLIIAGAVVIFFWRSLLLGLALIILAIAAQVVWSRLRISNAARSFRGKYQSSGKDLVLVYSNSPHWQSYIEEHWMPRWSARAVTLNWSERATWDRRRPEVALFDALATTREYNPLAIVVLPYGQPRVVRFWRAFRDHKHGRDGLLRKQESELETLLSLHGPPAA